MRKNIFIITIVILLQSAKAAETYDPTADALADIKSAIASAKVTNKHVFVKVGGDWCGWCKLYAKFTEADAEIMQVMEENYVVVLVNYSQENKNPAAMATLGDPQRFGFPVFVIIDGNGNILHTQDTALLEEGKGYNKQYVLRFLNVWTPVAMDPSLYQK